MGGEGQLESIPPEQVEAVRAMVGPTLLNDPKDYLTRVRCPVLAVFGADSLLFYGLLWLAVGVGCLVSTVATDRLGVQAAAELYRVERVRAGRETLQVTGTSQINT